MRKPFRASNIRREGKSFHRKSVKISNTRENFFINKTIPLWNDLAVNVKEPGTLDSFKVRLAKIKLFDKSNNLIAELLVNKVKDGLIL